HALDPARDHELRLAAPDGARGRAHGVEAGSAQAVHGGSRNRLRKPGQQQRHARHVAVVLARLIHAAVDHVVDGGPVDRRVAPDQRLDRERGEIVGADGRQRAPIAPERSANGVANEYFGHRGPWLREPAILNQAHASPVTGIAAPCIALAASEARNSTTSASASGATQRRGSALGMSLRFCGVSMMLGRTQFTLMPLSRSSAAMLSVRRITALFEAI